VTSPALLTLAGVGKHYRQGELVLNGVDLEMERGRVLGIIGASLSEVDVLLTWFAVVGDTRVPLRQLSHGQHAES
jgi:ABC-type transporter Mla maintaining outer membrane lipid asymmetry ATPase subunit MlaF